MILWDVPKSTRWSPTLNWSCFWREICLWWFLLGACLPTLIYRRSFIDAYFKLFFFGKKMCPICILVVIMLYPLVFMLFWRFALLSPCNSDPLYFTIHYKLVLITSTSCLVSVQNCKGSNTSGKSQNCYSEGWNVLVYT